MRAHAVHFTFACDSAGIDLGRELDREPCSGEGCHELARPQAQLAVCCQPPLVRRLCAVRHGPQQGMLCGDAPETPLQLASVRHSARGSAGLPGAGGLKLPPSARVSRCCRSLYFPSLPSGTQSPLAAAAPSSAHATADHGLC